MASVFDPYLRWLGIRDSQRPLNHYRLLGLDLFESDPDVIASAADRQMAHVRTFQTGEHAEVTQRILNELAAARVSLLKPDRKAAYDAELRTQFAARTDSVQSQQTVLVPVVAPLANSPTSVAQPGADGAGDFLDFADTQPARPRRIRRKPKQQFSMLPLIAIILAGLAFSVFAAWQLKSRDLANNPEQLASAKFPSSTPKAAKLPGADAAKRHGPVESSASNDVLGSERKEIEPARIEPVNEHPKPMPAPPVPESHVSVRVDAMQNRGSPLVTNVVLRKGDRFQFEPNPGDSWSGGGSKREVFCDYLGYPGSTVNWMRLHYQVGDEPAVPVEATKTYQAESDVTLKLFGEDGSTNDNRGSIGVVIKKLQ